MNANPPRVPGGRPGTAARRAACAALALTVSPAPAQEAAKPAESWPRAVPRLLIEPQFKEPTALRWRNGESLKGSLTEIGDTGISWTSELFKSPLLLRPEPLERIDFKGALLKRETPFRVILTDGSHLCGTPEKLENGRLFLRTAHSGLVALKQESLAAIERIGGEGMIAGGPQTFLEGTSTDSSEVGSVVPWYFAAAGQVASNAFRRGIALRRKLPDKSSVELLLKCDRKPEFSLKLAAEDMSCAVETWGDELVLTDGTEFASAGPVLQPGNGTAHLRLAWDRPARRSVLYSTEGKVLAELIIAPSQKITPLQKKTKAGVGTLGGALKQLFGLNETSGSPSVPPANAPAERGITFQNKGAGIVLEQFTVSEWSGQPLPALLGKQTGVETAEEAAPGEPSGISDGTLTLRGADGTTREFPMATVRAVRWDRPVKLERDPSLTELWFADGDLLRGRLTGAQNGTATLETAAAAQPVGSKWENGRALVLPVPDKNAAPKESLDKMDVLTSGAGTLHGKILPESEGALPKFAPVGAVVPVELAVSPSVNLTWARPEDSPGERAPVLLHLKGDETLPVKASGLESGTLQMAWEDAGSRQMDPGLIQAVQFASPRIAEGGFEVPGWQLLGTGREQPPRAAKKEEVTLAPGTAIAHPFLLQGAGLSFRMSSDSGMASIRVKLFSQGTDRSSTGLNYLIADYGSSVYAGAERTEGQINNQQDIPSRDGHTEIRCAFEGDQVEVFVNGVSLGRSKLDAKSRKKSGNGLIIETASLWGNQVGSVNLSDFSCRTSPFLVAPPVFTEEAKREALLLPRVRRDDPPKQVLIGRNGDLLRGEIEAMTSTHLAFRSGLEHFKVPIDRVAAAVWVKNPKPSAKEKTKEQTQAGGGQFPPEAPKASGGPPQTKADASKPGPPAARQWVDLTNGGRLAVSISAWNEKEVTATHPLLGEFRIPTVCMGSLRLDTPPPGTAQASLANWTLEATPDPVLPEAGGDSSPLNGKEAADFKLALLEGGDFLLKKQQGKVVVLDFWATWCGPCVKSLPGLVEAMAEFPPGQVIFLAVNQGETKDQVKRFLEARRLTMTVAMDADQAVAGKYGVEGIPHTVVIGPDGRIASVKTGYTPDGEKQIAEAVRQALNAKKPASSAPPEPSGAKPAEAPPAE